MTKKHIFKDCEVITTKMMQASGTIPYYCRVFINDQQRLAMTIHADSHKEAAAEARKMLVL